VVQEFRETYGIEQSAGSEHCIEASREKLRELFERPRGELRLCAMLIDGTPFQDRQRMVAAPQGPRVSGDFAAAGFLGQRSFPEFDCERGRRCVV